MKGEVNRAEAHQSEGGLIPLYHFNVRIATAQFRFNTPQLAVGSFILLFFLSVLVPLWRKENGTVTISFYAFQFSVVF